jgi:hypothetical protein
MYLLIDISDWWLILAAHRKWFRCQGRRKARSVEYAGGGDWQEGWWLDQIPAVQCADNIWAGAQAVTLREIFCREGCGSNLATGLRAAFVLALHGSIAISVHFQDVDMVDKLVQQRTGQPLRA